MAERARLSSKATDFWTVWHGFSDWCEPIPDVPEEYKPVLYATKHGKFRWVIGPYCLLTKVAQELKWNEKKKSCFDPDLQMALADFGVRYGARDTDVAPQRVAMKKRKAEVMTKPQKVGPNEKRESDQYPGLRDFWAGRTLEAHHIVEKGIFKVLRLNKKGSPLDDEYAPCVLAFAELHKRLFTPYFARAGEDDPAIREQFKGLKTAEAVSRKLQEVYWKSPNQSHLYARPEMSDLGQIAAIICEETKWFVG